MYKIKKICIIGTGYAAYNHFKCFSKLLKQKIIIVTRSIKKNKNLQKFRKKALIVQGIKNISKKIDGFVIAVPWHQNDNYLKIFMNNKKPILFEKPLSLSKQNILSISYKKNKFVALNRRYYKTIKYIKKKVSKNKKDIIDVELNLSENFNLFKKKFKKPQKFLTFFSSIHYLDLIIFLFGNPYNFKVLKRLFNKKQVSSGHYICNYKNFNCRINIFNNSSENNKLIIRFKNGEVFILNPIEKLKVYKSMKKENLGNNKYYIPILKKEIVDLKSHFKYGFFSQANAFLKNKMKPNIKEYLLTHNFIEKFI